MSANRDREVAIFNQALELDSAEARAAYLQRACGGDSSLRHKIEALLKAYAQPDSVLDNPPALAAVLDPQRPTPAATAPAKNTTPPAGMQADAELRPTSIAADRPEASGQRIGRYKLLENIGEGGCGIVYVAEQETPVRRRVALKLIKPGMDSRSVIARFEAERQALAMMDHPNIAKLFDAGLVGEKEEVRRQKEEGAQSESAGARHPSSFFPHTSLSGRPYFVMELIRGVKITDYCDQYRLSTAQRLDLFLQVCNAVHHAHQKGIIHRDLKPSNILVTVNDGVPVPKVIDFGIAKATEGRLTDLTVYTQLHQFIGTPAYMSPEQAEFTSRDIDTRSDIYSLGVLLYELLTGRTPFDPKKLLEAGLDEIRRTIREVEPPRPSTRLSTLANGDLATVAQARASEAIQLVNLLRGDLDWIAMKALEKDRSRRYDSAAALASDLKRFRADEPVLACPPSAAYQFRKLLRRHKLAFASGAAVAAALVLGATLAAWQAIVAREEAGRATREAQRAHQAQLQEARASQQAIAAERRIRRHLYVADMELAFRSFEAGDHSAAHKLVRKYSKPDFQPDPRGWEWRYLWGQTRDRAVVLGRHDSLVLWVEFSANGRWLGSIDYQGTLKLWDVAARRLWLSTNLFPGRVIPSLTWSPDSRFVAMGAFDSALKLWNVEERRIEASASLPEKIWQVAWSPDGKVLGCAGEQEVHLLEAATRKEIRRIPYGSSDDPKRLAFAPDNQTLAISYYGPTVELWNWRTAEKLSSLPAPPSVGAWKGMVGRVTFSPDGRLLAAINQNMCRLWDVASRQTLGVFTNHTDSIGGIAFAPDGQSILTSGGDDETLRLWDPRTQREHAQARNPSGDVISGCFAPDGRAVAFGSETGEVKLWLLPLTAPPPWEAHPLPDGIQSAWIWPQQRLLNFFGRDGSAHLWDLTAIKEIHAAPWPADVLAVSFYAPIQRRFLEYTKANLLQFRTVPGGQIEPFMPCELGDAKRDPIELALSDDGRLAAAASREVVRVWDIAARSELRRFQTDVRAYQYGLYFSPDAAFLLARAEDARMTIWRLDTGRSFTLPGHEIEGNSLRFLPDGQRFVTTSLDGLVKLRDLRSERDLDSFNNGIGGCGDSALSPDGMRWVFAAFAGRLQFWDLDSNRQIALLRTNDRKTLVTRAAFLDDHTLATVFDHELRIWRAPAWDEIEQEETLRAAEPSSPKEAK